jgi:hypothetical protein
MARKSLIKRAADNGWYFSIPPIIVKLQHFQMVAEMVKMNQLLTETYCPYLSPFPGVINEPAFVFGDNQSVLANTTNPSSTLKKKSNAIAFEFVREGVARDEWRTAYINTHDNIADLLTKPLAGEKRRKFVSMILHHIYSQGSSDGKGED